MEEKLFDGSFFQCLSRICLIGNQRMNGGRSGGRRSLAKGSSVEFADFREYLPGDDIRRIDWNAYGRMDRLFVKLFMQEQEGMYTILLDTSGSMKFGTPEKSVVASRLAGAFGYLALRSQDRVRLVSVSDGETIVEQSITGIQGFQRYLGQIERKCFDGHTQLWKSMKKVPFPKRGCTIILSDFMEQGADAGHMEQIKQVFQYLRYQKQEIVLLRILSREEIMPSQEGTLCLVDQETGQELKVTMSGGLRREYEKQSEKYRTELKKLAKQYQAHFLEIATEQKLDQVIYEGICQGFLEQR